MSDDFNQDFGQQAVVPAPKKSKALWWILGILAVLIIIPVGCCGGLAWWGYGQVTAPRDAAIAALEQDASVSAKLGTPISAGNRIEINDFQNNNNNGSAHLNFDVSGPSGSADVDAKMKLTAGTWTHESITVTYSDGTSDTLP